MYSHALKHTYTHTLETDIINYYNNDMTECCIVYQAIKFVIFFFFWHNLYSVTSPHFKFCAKQFKLP